MSTYEHLVYHVENNTIVKCKIPIEAFTNEYMIDVKDKIYARFYADRLFNIETQTMLTSDKFKETDGKDGLIYFKDSIGCNSYIDFNLKKANLFCKHDNDGTLLEHHNVCYDINSHRFFVNILKRDNVYYFISSRMAKEVKFFRYDYLKRDRYIEYIVIDNILCKITNYDNNKLNGVTITYCQTTHNPLMIENYLDDQLHGMVCAFQKFGKKIYERTYENGTLKNEIFFDENGNPRIENPIVVKSYLFGKLRGKTTTIGNKRTVELFDHDEKLYKTDVYEDEKIVSQKTESYYKTYHYEDLGNTLYTKFNSDGSINEIGYYTKYWKKTSRWTFFNDKGVVVKKCIHDGETEHDIVIYNDNGVQIKYIRKKTIVGYIGTVYLYTDEGHHYDTQEYDDEGHLIKTTKIEDLTEIVIV